MSPAPSGQPADVAVSSLSSKGNISRLPSIKSTITSNRIKLSKEIILLMVYKYIIPPTCTTLTFTDTLRSFRSIGQVVSPSTTSLALSSSQLPGTNQVHCCCKILYQFNQATHHHATQPRQQWLARPSTPPSPPPPTFKFVSPR